MRESSPSPRLIAGCALSRVWPTPIRSNRSAKAAPQTPSRAARGPGSESTPALLRPRASAPPAHRGSQPPARAGARWSDRASAGCAQPRFRRRRQAVPSEAPRRATTPTQTAGASSPNPQFRKSTNALDGGVVALDARSRLGDGLRGGLVAPARGSCRIEVQGRVNMPGARDPARLPTRVLRHACADEVALAQPPQGGLHRRPAAGTVLGRDLRCRNERKLDDQPTNCSRRRRSRHRPELAPNRLRSIAPRGRSRCQTPAENTANRPKAASCNSAIAAHREEQV